MVSAQVFLIDPFANAGQHWPGLIPLTAGVVAADALGGHVILVNLLPLRSVSANESSPVFVGFSADCPASYRLINDLDFLIFAPWQR